MLNVKISKDRSFSSNSKEIPIKKGKKYLISTEVKGDKGKYYSGYFGVVLLDENQKEVERKIQWLNDFSGVTKQIQIVSKLDCDFILTIYRINVEVPIKSECQFELLPLNKINISEVKPDTIEKFYDVSDFVIPKTNDLSDEQESVLEKNLVWVIGVFRSGTTWLGTQLLSYNTLTLDESEIGFHLGSMRGEFEDKLVRDIEHFGNTPSYFFAKMYKKTWLPLLRKLIINRFYAQFQDLNKKMIIKEPSASMVADIISECLPNSKLIIILRDGRDVIDSTIDALQKNTWRTDTTGTPKALKNKSEFIKRLSKGWNKRTEIMLKAFSVHAKDKCILVKYENLRNNTLEELEKIYKFLEIEIDKKTLLRIVEKYSFENIPSGLKGKGKFARSASPGKWKENFSEEEKKIMNDVMGEKLGNLGY